MPISPRLEVAVRRNRVLVASIAIALALGGCGNDEATPPVDADPNALAVHSLLGFEGVITSVVGAFEQENGDLQVDVTLSEGPALVKAISAGTPDVVMIPTPWLESLVSNVDPDFFGRSLAVIAVPADNPGDVTDLTAFAADSGLSTAVCAGAPGPGNFGFAVLAKAGVTPDPATVGSGCEAEVLGRLAAGDLDAGLMFRAGLEIPDGVVLRDVPEDQNIVVDFSLGALNDSDLATAFTDFVGSDAAQRILTDSGFLP